MTNFSAFLYTPVSFNSLTTNYNPVNRYIKTESNVTAAFKVKAYQIMITPFSEM